MSFNFVPSDCPARETVWTFPACEIGYPCPDPVQLSPEKIEIAYEYTFYVFSDGSRWRLDYYHEHIESVPLYGPYLSDYGINRKDKQEFTPVATYQATNDMFE